MSKCHTCSNTAATGSRWCEKCLRKQFPTDFIEHTYPRRSKLELECENARESVLKAIATRMAERERQARQIILGY